MTRDRQFDHFLNRHSFFFETCNYNTHTRGCGFLFASLYLNRIEVGVVEVTQEEEHAWAKHFSKQHNERGRIEDIHLQCRDADMNGMDEE